MRTTLLSLVALLAVAAQAVAAPAGVNVTSMTFNPGLLIQLVNNPTSFNPGQAVGILTAQVSNPGTVPVVNPAFNISVTEVGNPSTSANCPGAVVVSTNSPLATNKTVAPGATAVLLASDFVQANNISVTLCQAFTSDLESQFKDVSPSDLGGKVQQLLNRRFTVCITDAATGSQACTDLTVFTQPAANLANAAQLVMPQDKAVLQGAPVFVWTPASYKGDSSGIDYQLVLSKEPGGNPWKTIDDLPSGQTYYQWADATVLEPGLYYWHVVSKRHSNGALVGGQSGQGWAVERSFTVRSAGGEAGNCSYSMDDLDKFVRDHAGDKAALLKGLHLDHLQPASLNDPDLCRLLASPQVRLVGITVNKR